MIKRSKQSIKKSKANAIAASDTRAGKKGARDARSRTASTTGVQPERSSAATVEEISEQPIRSMPKEKVKIKSPRPLQLQFWDIDRFVPYVRNARKNAVAVDR